MGGGHFNPRTNEGYDLVCLKLVMKYHSHHSVRFRMKAVSTSGPALWEAANSRTLKEHLACC